MFQDMIMSELKKRMAQEKLNLPVSMVGNNIEIIIPRDEIVNQLLSGFPANIRPFIMIEANDIKIRIRLG